MIRHAALWIVTGALATAGHATLPATVLADTVTVSDTYSFSLEQDRPQPTLLLTNGDQDTYQGDTTIQLSQFDDQGATRILESVELTIGMAIVGTIQVDYETPPADVTLTLQQYGEGIEVSLSGNASAGPLSANPQFESPFTAEPDNGVLFINQVADPGQDSANSGLGGFIGLGDVDIDISALVEVVYHEVGEIGSVLGLTASGDVSLAYTYRLVSNPIPTPAASALGLALLAAAAVRRRRPA